MTDLEIAQSAKIEKITQVINKVDLSEDDLQLFGPYKAKVKLDVLQKMNHRGKVILVTAITPTQAGEGKSTVTIGLGDALNRLEKRTVVALREPSMGPVMGIKGGAAGGGYAQVIPMEDINLHFTGDIHAITAANNLIAAILDNHIHQGNALQIDPRRIIWKRCMDMNDRSLRNIVLGLGGPVQGMPREDHFDITVASEVMAVLCLANTLEDFKKRIECMVVAYRYDKTPVTVKDLDCAGAVAMVMKDAMMPNVVQTLEHNVALVHGGPFANIAHGCNSLIATRMARHLADYVVTEAGFGADLGAEKFLDIKCRAGGFKPSCVVIVATVRALKMHGGVAKKDLGIENIGAMLDGIKNLEKHIQNIKKFELPYVVAINKFSGDSIAELEALNNWAEENGHDVSLTDVWGKGSEGGLDLAEKVVEKVETEDGACTFKHLYSCCDSIPNKLRTIAQKIYGAKDVDFSRKALNQIKQYEELGWDKLPICVAKTQYSLSDNPKLLGRPSAFTISVREFKPSIGAGFIVALTGNVMTMPGLPKQPAAMNMDVVNGKIEGLF